MKTRFFVRGKQTTQDSPESPSPTGVIDPTFSVVLFLKQIPVGSWFGFQLKFLDLGLKLGLVIDVVFVLDLG